MVHPLSQILSPGGRGLFGNLSINRGIFNALFENKIDGKGKENG